MTTDVAAAWVEATYSIHWYRDGADSTRTMTGVVWSTWGIDERDPGSWWVTHLPTGKAFGEFLSLTSAQSFAREIDPLAPWSTITIDNSEQVSKRIRTKVRKIRTRWNGI